MGGIGGGLYLGFMLTEKEWLKIYEIISPEADKKKVKKNKNTGKSNSKNNDDGPHIYEIVRKIAEEINGLFKINVQYFQNQQCSRHNDEDYNKSGLGICVGRGFTEVSVSDMAKHVEQAKELEEVAKTYGLGKPIFYLIDEECY